MKTKNRLLLAIYSLLLSGQLAFAESKPLVQLVYDHQKKELINETNPNWKVSVENAPGIKNENNLTIIKFDKGKQFIKMTPPKSFKLEEYTISCQINPTSNVFGAQFFEASGLRIVLDRLYPKIYFFEKSQGKPRYFALYRDKNEAVIKPGEFSDLSIVVKKDGAQIFVNGQVVATHQSSGGILPINSQFFLGNRSDKKIFNGEIAGLRIYDKALNQKEILAECGFKLAFSFEDSLNKKYPEKETFYAADGPEVKNIAKDIDCRIGFTGKPYDRFIEGEKKNVFLNIKNHSAQVEKITLKTEIEDWREKVVSKSEKTIEILPGETSKTEINLDPKGGKGCFLLLLKVYSGEKLVFNASKPYAVTVDASAAIDNKDTPFGHHHHHARFGTPKLQELSCSEVRIFGSPTGWGLIEPSPGKYNWEAADHTVNYNIAKKRNILYEIYMVPTWAANAPKSLTEAKMAPLNIAFYAGRYPVKDLKNWEKFIRKLATRYKGKIKYWEILNEVDSSYFRGSPEDYLKMLKSAYQTLKSVDPDCKVVGVAGTSQWYSFTKKLFELGGAEYMDVLSIHFYMPPRAPESAGLIRSINAAKKLIQSSGKHLELWDTEGSYWSPRRKFDGRMYKVPSGNKELPVRKGTKKTTVGKCVGERRIAAFYLRKRLLSLAHGVNKYYLFDIHGMPFDHYPLNLVAHENMVKNISNKKFNKFIPIGGPHLFALVFGEGKDQVVVLWSSDGDSDVTLNCDAKQVSKLDFLGNEKIIDSTKPITLTLNDYPVYLLGCGAKIAATGSPFEFSSLKNIHIGGELPVKIKNDSLEKGEFKAKICEQDQSILAESKSAVIDPGTEVEILIKIPATLKAQNARLLLEMATAKRNYVKTNPIRLSPAPFIMPKDSNVKIDGEHQEWENAAKINMNEENQVVIGKYNPNFIGLPHWKGVRDSSLAISAKWDEKGLYFAFDITDDNVKINESRPFLGDCIEFFLDTRPAETLGNPVYAEGVYHIFIVPPSDAKEPRIIFSEWSKKCNQAILPKVKVAGKETPRGYIMELFLPMKNLHAGKRIGFDIALDDADEKENEGKRKAQMIYNGGGANYRDASGFAIMELEKDKKH